MKHENFGVTTKEGGFFRVTVLGVVARNKADNKIHHRHVFPSLWEITSKTIATVKGQKERWMTFDVSSFVNYVINVRRKHVKLVLRVKPLGGTSIDPKLMGINNHLKFETERGLLVIYTGDDVQPSPKVTKKRSKRDTSSSSRSKKRRNNKRDKRRRRRRKKACRRKNMVVDFDKFGWSNFLIQPTKQNLYHCHGNCDYPVPSHIKTSNHATIQSIWHGMNLKNPVPAPCCVPDEFDVLPVLSLDGNDRVVFKMKEGLIVKSCACR